MISVAPVVVLPISLVIAAMANAITVAINPHIKMVYAILNNLYFLDSTTPKK